ncbi:GH25 family lysozyme [Lactiplantibacillus pentosus]
MKISKLGWVVVVAVATSLSGGLTAKAQGQAVVDISEWQGRLTPSQVQAMKGQVLFVINRRQYGIGYVDRDAVNNTALYVRYGIPFGEYDFSQFTDAASARREAQAFYARSNKAARFYALDFEVDTVRSGSTNAAVAAWYHEMRSLTKKKLIFYSYASFALTYANQARQHFDAQWIGAITRNPPIIPAALWQYTDRYHLAGLAAPVDNSRVMTGVHPVSWWLGTTKAVVHHVSSQRTTTPAVSVYHPRPTTRPSHPVIKLAVTSTHSQSSPTKSTPAKQRVKPVVRSTRAVKRLHQTKRTSLKSLSKQRSTKSRTSQHSVKPLVKSATAKPVVKSVAPVRHKTMPVAKRKTVTKSKRVRRVAKPKRAPRLSRSRSKSKNRRHTVSLKRVSRAKRSSSARTNRQHRVVKQNHAVHKPMRNTRR